MVEQIRYYQLQRQRQSLGGLLAAQPIVTYQKRDPITGQRVMQAADGSIDHCTYLSDSEPATIPQYQPGRSIGVPGFVNNR
jgi:hypothetical protein